MSSCGISKGTGVLINKYNVKRIYIDLPRISAANNHSSHATPTHVYNVLLNLRHRSHLRPPLQNPIHGTVRRFSLVDVSVRLGGVGSDKVQPVDELQIVLVNFTSLGAVTLILQRHEEVIRGHGPQPRLEAVSRCIRAVAVGAVSDGRWGSAYLGLNHCRGNGTLGLSTHFSSPFSPDTLSCTT